MRRREFITLLGGAAVACPRGARGQQATQIRRIGVLIGLAEADHEGQARVGAFRKGLEDFGWHVGRNISIDYRWAPDADQRRAAAVELVKLNPDVIFAAANPATLALQQVTRAVPIVFAQVGDPVRAGLVATFSRPGGNITGFLALEDEFAGKWLELLKELAPRLRHADVMYDPTNPSWQPYLREMDAVAPKLGLTLGPQGVRASDEIERVIATLSRDTEGGLVVLPSPVTTMYRGTIVALAERYRIVAIYPYRYFATLGGLVSFGVDNLDLYRRAASYVDRILNGAKPADLPVQAPTKYELAINLKTAKALGLTVPPTLLARADEVIE